MGTVQRAFGKKGKLQESYIVRKVSYMNTGEIILFVFMLILALAAFIISILQFKQKGILFNNAYLYASKKERETMDKKPHYRQSAITFLFIGIVFSLLAIEIVFTTKWLFFLVMLTIISMIIYAIVSSIDIERKNK